MGDLEIVGKEGNDLLVKVPGLETYVKIEDTYAEMFPTVEISPANLHIPLFFSLSSLFSYSFWVCGF